jgi:hypothetical protein
VNTTAGIPGVFNGGINFLKFSANNGLSLPNSNVIGLVSQANFDPFNSTNTCLNVVQLNDLGPPLGQYDGLTDFAVGRLLVGGPYNGYPDGVGTDIQFSGPKSFITGVNNDWSVPNPPYTGDQDGPCLLTSPIKTKSVLVSTVYGPNDSTLIITNNNGSLGNIPPNLPLVAVQTLSWVPGNSGSPSTFASTIMKFGDGDSGTDITIIPDKAQGGLNVYSDTILLYGQDEGIKCGVAQIYEGFTQIWNQSGVYIGAFQNGPTPFEIQIPSAQSTIITGNMFVSSLVGVSTINGAPAAGGYPRSSLPISTLTGDTTYIPQNNVAWPLSQGYTPTAGHTYRISGNIALSNAGGSGHTSIGVSGGVGFPAFLQSYPNSQLTPALNGAAGGIEGIVKAADTTPLQIVAYNTDPTTSTTLQAYWPNWVIEDLGTGLL